MKITQIPNLQNGESISVCYTLDSDDITKGKKPPQTPYKDRTDTLVYDGEKWYGKETDSALTVTPFHQGLLLELTAEKTGLSEYGINLPFNFMGKKNGGGWENQLLFNTPYSSPDKKFKYFYLTNPKGNNLLVAVLSPADGWKMDYSPYGWGHFFVNLKLLASYDRAYGTQSKRNYIKFAVLPVGDYNSCLDTLSQIYNAPFLDYDVSGGEVGTEITLFPHGKIDTVIEEYNGETNSLPFDGKYTVSKEGEVYLTPVFNGVKGATVTVYGYKSLYALYKKSVESVDLDTIENHTDGNLCEHQCWASAILRFLMRYGDSLTQNERATLEGKVNTLLNVITQEDEEKAVPHRTILSKPHDQFPAYNVYKSTRVQELAFGITILLDAYKYFKNERYLTYAVGATQCLITYYQKEDGRIEVDWGCAKEDYTTVCCPMIPLCDMASYLKGTPFGDKLRSCCDKMAEFLYNRGLNFPTEGGQSDQTDTEMEDGSISCTALALLYYSLNIQRVEKYIAKAKEILDIHESWIIKAPICQMHGSTLRWWETQWEGDADGPAICAGHAWSIWRGEADLLYYMLTKNNDYLIKAKNTFMTNLSKIQPNGTTYSTYNPDEINGGGFSDKAENVKFRIAKRFADQNDSGISRYVWIRIGQYI